MTRATTVFLIRHAVHDRVDAVLCGRMPDVLLGARGIAQAAALAARLAGERLDAVLSSPLERCRQTAAPIAARAGLALEIEDGVNEIAFGAWAGRRFDMLDADPAWQHWNAARGTARTPGGETMRDVQLRASGAIRRVAQRWPDGRVAVVSHADVLKAALMDVLGLSLDRHDRFELGPASVSVVVLWDGGGKVISVNA